MTSATPADFARFVQADLAAMKKLAGQIGGQLGNPGTWLPVAVILGAIGVIPAMPQTIFLPAAALAAWPSAWAQSTWPTRPVRIVVPFAPGNTLDTALRVVAEVFKQNTGQALVIDSKPGGSGIIAAQSVAQAAPDGYTLLLSNTSMMTINPHTFAKLPYDPEKSFRSVSNFLGKKLVIWGDAVVSRIPVVRSIYSSVKQVSDTLFSESGNAFRTAVLIQWPRADVWTIGFVTGAPGGDVTNYLSGEYLSVYVPTTPNPTGGYFVMVPRSQCVELAMSVDEALTYVISMGVIVPGSPKNPKLKPAAALPDA